MDNEEEFEEIKGEIRLEPTPEEIKAFVKSMDEAVAKFYKKRNKDI